MEYKPGDIFATQAKGGEKSDSSVSDLGSILDIGAGFYSSLSESCHPTAATQTSYIVKYYRNLDSLGEDKELKCRLEKFIRM